MTEEKKTKAAPSQAKSDKIRAEAVDEGLNEEEDAKTRKTSKTPVPEPSQAEADAILERAYNYKTRVAKAKK